MNKMTWYIQGLWILGAIFMFLAAMIAGNIEWISGTTEYSYGIAIIMSLALFLLAGVCWISSAVNARKEEKIQKNY